MTHTENTDVPILAAQLRHLQRGGTSVLVDVSGPPIVVYWGEALGAVSDEALASLAIAARPQRVSGGLDTTGRPGVLATPADGWLGTPRIEGHRSGRDVALRFEATAVEGDASAVAIDLADAQSGLAARAELELGPAGVLRQRLTITNTAPGEYTLQRLEAAFPLPWDATELLDTTGRHLRERSGQRHELTFGTHVRESRRGRPGADATLLLAAGRPGFGFERGTVHGIHVAWSGNSRVFAERGTSGDSLLAGGELYGAGEIRLAEGESISSPVVHGSWGDGLNELAARFHAEQRARPTHPATPRPVTLNTWEAVYFNHDLDRLLALLDAGATVGVERFVLDDGWFTGRRSDTTALGDWTVDEDVWPDGLHPLANAVVERGIEFGLWVEPEMISPESELARSHPDWILRGREELPPVGRQQQVLDLTNPDAFAYISGRLHALLDEYPIGYLKWDHNRDLVDAAAGPGGPLLVHGQTSALYRLIDELKAAHPGVEIESCASGGARVDLGILERTDRIWTSDCLDPIERLEIQRYTGLVVAPELMGMHLTTPQVHSTGRTVPIGLSGAVSLFGHAGIEWDLTRIGDEDRALVAEWVELAKRVRPLVATGALVHADTGERGLDVRGVVAADRASAFFTLTQSETLIASPSGRIRLPGLDPDREYRIRVATPGGVVDSPAQSPLEWAARDTVLTGRSLSTAGIRPPVQNPQRSVVLELSS